MSAIAGNGRAGGVIASMKCLALRLRPTARFRRRVGARRRWYGAWPRWRGQVEREQIAATAQWMIPPDGMYIEAPLLVLRLPRATAHCRRNAPLCRLYPEHFNAMEMSHSDRGAVRPSGAHQKGRWRPPIFLCPEPRSEDVLARCLGRDKEHMCGITAMVPHLTRVVSHSHKRERGPQSRFVFIHPHHS